MSEPEARAILIHVFTRLRLSGLPLGIGELLAAFQATDCRGRNESAEELRRIARLLWCPFPQTDEFEEIWSAAMSTLSNTSERDKDDDKASLSPLPERSTEYGQEMYARPSAVSTAGYENRATAAEWTALPVRVTSQPEFQEMATDLHAYWPVSKRHMTYTWRYLRRPVPDGPANILDVAATVEQVARQGFYLSPTYRRGLRNDAQLVLLVDQGGSMVPFHRFTRDLIDTARGNESPIRQVEVFFFHNVPSQDVYADAHLTEPVPWNRASIGWSNDTSILIVSDAGAARNRRRLDRIGATTALLARLKRTTTRLAWLNPVPKDRWLGTSAQITAHVVAMFQMDPAGFSNAIDILRGQPFHYGSRS